MIEKLFKTLFPSVYFEIRDNAQTELCEQLVHQKNRKHYFDDHTGTYEIGVIESQSQCLDTASAHEGS